MLVTSIFSFSHNVFKRLFLYCRWKSGLCGKELNEWSWIESTVFFKPCTTTVLLQPWKVRLFQNVAWQMLLFGIFSFYHKIYWPYLRQRLYILILATCEFLTAKLSLWMHLRFCCAIRIYGVSSSWNKSKISWPSSNCWSVACNLPNMENIVKHSSSIPNACNYSLQSPKIHLSTYP